VSCRIFDIKCSFLAQLLIKVNFLGVKRFFEKIYLFKCGVFCNIFCFDSAQWCIARNRLRAVQHCTESKQKMLQKTPRCASGAKSRLCAMHHCAE
jgi:hypothetical protein